MAEVSRPTEGAPDANTPPPTTVELARAFPHLEILELIGRGGMGFVYRARQPKLDRVVALKILPQALAADPAFTERFTREGRVLARLNHPNIVTVHDFGQAKGFSYLLMEFVEGVNLRQAMRAGRFTPAEALSLVPAICEALQYAHNEGILHRDIKPENILLDTRGRVKIADFGIAKLVGEAKGAWHTESGATVGTPHYMAPEQIEHPAEVDHRADIYSLGVVLYELLTGELPLGRFLAPSQKTPVSAGVDAVVLRALEKERERRFQSAGEVKTQVENLSGHGSSAPTSPKDRKSWSAAKVVAVTLSALLGCGLLVSLVLVVLYSSRYNVVESDRATSESTNSVVKVIELVDITNHLHGVRAGSHSPLEPNESLLAIIQQVDGRTEQSMSHTFWRPVSGRVTTSAFLSWILPSSFSEKEIEAACEQVRKHHANRGLFFRPGDRRALFTVTNDAGGTVQGFVEFQRETAVAPATARGSVRIKEVHELNGGFWASLDVTRPRGYALLATDNGCTSDPFVPRTSIGRSSGRVSYDVTFYLSRNAGQNLVKTAISQMKMWTAPLDIAPSERTRVFSVTNGTEMCEGFLEFIAALQPKD